MEEKNIIGKGAQALVYKHEGCALKVFTRKRRKSEVLFEAMINSIVYELGIKVPKIHEVLEIQDKDAIKMDLLEGKSLFDSILDSGGTLDECLKILVYEQLKINRMDFNYPISFKGKTREKILYSKDLSDERKSEVLKMTDYLPEGNKLCHGDFHGENIIVKGDDYYIIDWDNASGGAPGGDACRTYMLFLIYCPEIAEGYLELYCKEAEILKEDVLRWLPPILAGRISDNIPGEREKILPLLDTLLSSK